MNRLATLAFLAFALVSRAADWRPADIHPKVFQMVDCWLSDTAAPVVTEINLDAVRTNRNQFSYAAVTSEADWITFREDRQLLRFKVTSSRSPEYSVVYQENGGGTLTTQRTIRFVLTPRSFDVDGHRVSATVLRIVSIATKE